jgi:hypothetical protein
VILAIDPGTTESGWVEYEAGRVVVSGVSSNYELVTKLIGHHAQKLAIEMIASYGMPVGKEVFETCVWIGRFIAAYGKPLSNMQSFFVYRKDVKLHLCGTSKAKDGNIRQALIDKLGPQGTKANPGPTYGVKSHAWAALAVAVTAAETKV